jgi:hypothetical protein
MGQRETMFLVVLSPRSLVVFPGQATRYRHSVLAHMTIIITSSSECSLTGWQSIVPIPSYQVVPLMCSLTNELKHSENCSLTGY